MRRWKFVWIVVIVAILLDLYVFQAVKSLTQGASPRWRTIIYGCYWGATVLALLILLMIPFVPRHTAWLNGYAFFIVIGLYFAKLLTSLFLLIDDLRRLIQWGAVRLFGHPSLATGSHSEGISRSVFLSWLGIGIGGGLLSTLIYGFSNKYNYRIRRVRLVFENLPASFKGLKINTNI